MSLQPDLVDPKDEETGDVPMKKSRRTLNDACRFDSVDHLPVHCDSKSAANCVDTLSCLSALNVTVTCV